MKALQLVSDNSYTGHFFHPEVQAMDIIHTLEVDEDFRLSFAHLVGEYRHAQIGDSFPDCEYIHIIGKDTSGVIQVVKFKLIVPTVTPVLMIQ